LRGKRPKNNENNNYERLPQVHGLMIIEIVHLTVEDELLYYKALLKPLAMKGVEPIHEKTRVITNEVIALLLAREMGIKITHRLIIGDELIDYKVLLKHPNMTGVATHPRVQETIGDEPTRLYIGLYMGLEIMKDNMTIDVELPHLGAHETIGNMKDMMTIDVEHPHLGAHETIGDMKDMMTIDVEHPHLGAHKTIEELLQAGTHRTIEELLQAGIHKTIEELLQAGIHKAIQGLLQAEAHRTIEGLLQAGGNLLLYLRLPDTMTDDAIQPLRARDHLHLRLPDAKTGDAI
jgi:hypothetical protein